MLCVSVRLLGAAGAQHAPQPTMALEGEALTSSMHSVPPLERYPPAPTQRVGRWRGRGSKVAFCFISVTMRGLTTRAGRVAVQGHPPEQLPELWPSCPCWQPRKGAWHVQVLSCWPPPMAARPSQGSCGMEQARGLHLPPPQAGSAPHGSHLDAQILLRPITSRKLYHSVFFPAFPLERRNVIKLIGKRSQLLLMLVLEAVTF